MLNSKPTIFISAVSSELKSARQLVANTLQFLGYEPVWQDIFATEQGNLLAMLRRKVEASSGVIQLIGRRYGFEPPVIDPKFGRVSYTQYEAMYARQLGKKVWYLRVSDNFPTDPVQPEAAELAQLQAAYAAKLGGVNIFHTLASFDAVETSVLKLRDDLSKLRTAARRWSMGVTAALLLILGLVTWLVLRPDSVSWLKSALVPMAQETHEIKSIVGVTSDETKAIHTAVVDQTAKLADVAAGVQDTKKEVSADPRKELQNLGVASTAEGFEACARSGDLRALALFMQAGFSPNEALHGIFPINFAYFQRVSDESDVLDLFVKSGLNFKSRGPDLNNSLQPPPNGETMEHQVLYTAIRHHDEPGLRALLKAGADPTDWMEERHKKIDAEQQQGVSRRGQNPHAGGSPFLERDLKELNFLEMILGKPLTQLAAASSASTDAAAQQEKQDAIDTDNDAKMFARLAAARRGQQQPTVKPGDADLQAGLAAYAKEDYATAAGLFQSSASAGNTLAMVRLGTMYEVGLIVQKNPQYGYKLFKQAADAGDTNGVYAMGFAAETGQGVSQDHDAAVELMKQAAVGGSRNAAVWLQQHGN